MANAKIILECPNCDYHQEVEYKWDHNSSEPLRCNACSFTVAKWCWNYICNVKDLPNEEESYGADLDTQNGICNANVPYEMW